MESPRAAEGGRRLEISPAERRDRRLDFRVDTIGQIPLIVAHRGASRDAPENTRASFRRAWEQGADAIEGDFRLTRDRRVVCIHDDRTGRTCGAHRIVADSTLAQLRELDAGGWKGPRWSGERIPTLDEVLDMLPPGKRLFLEIKSGPELVPRIKKIIRARQFAPERIVVISFDPGVVETAKRELPEIAANLLITFVLDSAAGRWTPSAGEAAAAALRVRADGVGFQNHAAADGDFVRTIQNHGLAAHVWTVNDVAGALRYARLGVCSITTDCPGPLREGMIGSRNSAPRLAAEGKPSPDEER